MVVFLEVRHYAEPENDTLYTVAFNPAYIVTVFPHPYQGSYINCLGASSAFWSPLSVEKLGALLTQHPQPPPRLRS